MKITEAAVAALKNHTLRGWGDWGLWDKKTRAAHVLVWLFKYDRAVSGYVSHDTLALAMAELPAARQTPLDYAYMAAALDAVITHREN